MLLAGTVLSQIFLDVGLRVRLSFPMVVDDELPPVLNVGVDPHEVLAPRRAHWAEI